MKWYAKNCHRLRKRQILKMKIIMNWKLKPMYVVKYMNWRLTWSMRCLSGSHPIMLTWPPLPWTSYLLNQTDWTLICVPLGNWHYSPNLYVCHAILISVPPKHIQLFLNTQHIDLLHHYSINNNTFIYFQFNFLF